MSSHKERYYVYGHNIDGSKILEFTTNSKKRALKLRDEVKKWRNSASIVDTKEISEYGLPKKFIE